MRYIVLDIETVPIANAAEFLPWSEIEPDGRLKDPVKVAADIAQKQEALIASAGLDMDLARIVAIATQDGGIHGPAVSVLRSEEDESKALEALAYVLDQQRNYSDVLTIITFYGHKFDLPLLMRRARYLGVDFPKLNLDRYKSPHIDLHEELTMRGAIKAHPLRWYFRRHGWTDLLDSDPLVNGGADVTQAVAEGKWDDVAAHVMADVAGTVRLAAWLGFIPKADVL